jgi:Brp/Blh family beta-carotene 15,15'-monooxygenase
MPVLLHRTVPWTFAGLSGLLGFLFPTQTFGLAPLFFLSSAVILGVPHGACDPWVPGWVRQKPYRIPFLFWFFVVYLALSFLYLLVWKAAPFGATVFFLFLTAWHWGTADASLVFPPGLRWFFFGFGRGLWVMLAPFGFHTLEAWRVVLLMAPAAGPAPSPVFFQSLLVVPLLLTLASRPGKTEWGETGLLLLLLALTPPLVGVGTYFVAFHAWRHLLRLAEIRDMLTLKSETKNWLRSLGRLLLFAVPLTVATLVLLPALPRFLGLHPANHQEWVGSYLILLAVLTLPHAILVGWVDWKSLNLKR